MGGGVGAWVPKQKLHETWHFALIVAPLSQYPLQYSVFQDEGGFKFDSEVLTIVATTLATEQTAQRPWHSMLESVRMLTHTMALLHFDCGFRAG